MNIDLAWDIAERMGVLYDFPKIATQITQVGEFIADLCKTDEEGEWLLREVTLSGKYARWGGPGWLKQIYDDRFGPSVGVLPEYHLDKSNGQMTEEERIAWIEEMAAIWKVPVKAEAPAAPVPRVLTAVELEALSTRKPSDVVALLAKAKVIA